MTMRIRTAGGSSGIGKAAAIAFDANKCSVAVLGRRFERLEAVVSPSLLPTFLLREFIGYK